MRNVVTAVNYFTKAHADGNTSAAATSSMGIPGQERQKAGHERMRYSKIDTQPGDPAQVNDDLTRQESQQSAGNTPVQAACRQQSDQVRRQDKADQVTAGRTGKNCQPAGAACEKWQAGQPK